MYVYRRVVVIAVVADSLRMVLKYLYQYTIAHDVYICVYVCVWHLHTYQYVLLLRSGIHTYVSGVMWVFIIFVDVHTEKPNKNISSTTENAFLFQVIVSFKIFHDIFFLLLLLYLVSILLILSRIQFVFFFSYFYSCCSPVVNGFFFLL